MSNEVLVTQTTELDREVVKEDFSFFTSFDITMVRIIQKFYGNILDPVNGNLNCYHVRQLHSVLSKEGLKIGLEGLRKKLDFLVKIGFLEKVNTYPRVYMPLKHVDGIKKIQGKIEQLKKIFL